VVEQHRLVMLAMDDNVMIVGAPGDGDKNQGSVYIYRRNCTSWTKESKLTPDDDLTTADYGSSVSVKGSLVVVGDPGRLRPQTGHDKKGAVFVYRFDVLARFWTSVGGSQMEYACDKWSYVVRLLDEEELLVVCGECFSDSSAVYHYEKPGMGDSYVLKQDIRFQNPVTSLAVDRNTMVVVEFRVGRSFAIHVFLQKKNVWEEVATIDESIFGKRFGEAVALSENVTVVASDRNVYQMALF